MMTSRLSKAKDRQKSIYPLHRIYCQIKVPFAKVTETTNKVALYRKVAEINFAPLSLSQIYLKENTLWFEYESPIPLCEPYKVYDVLREICVYADKYDDEFIDKYKTEFLHEPKITPLTENEKEEVWQQISNILDDYKQYSVLFREKRWDDFQWDIAIISILIIVNMPCVHGTLRTTLEDYVYELYDGNIDFRHRRDKGLNYMQKLCNKTKEEFMKDIYHAESFISLKWRSSTEILQNRTKNMEQYVNNYIKKGDNFMLCYYLQSSFLHIIYNYNLEEHHTNAIHDVLEKVSNKTIDEAAPLLTDLFYKFLDGTAGERTVAHASSSTKKQSKGFFARLFS